jgi:hypothetical protein
VPQGATATVVIAALAAWAILVHPGRGDGTMRGALNTTFTISTTTSSEQNGCGPVDPKSKGTKIEPKPAKHQKQLGVATNGPLGPATLDTAKEVELCIPSTAALP